MTQFFGKRSIKIFSELRFPLFPTIIKNHYALYSVMLFCKREILFIFTCTDCNSCHCSWFFSYYGIIKFNFDQIKKRAFLYFSALKFYVNFKFLKHTRLLIKK